MHSMTQDESRSERIALTRDDEHRKLAQLTTLLGNVANRITYDGISGDPYEHAPQINTLTGAFVSPRSRRHDDLIKALEALELSARAFAGSLR